MEGRTIARPDECRPQCATRCDHWLQWRAGQLPGQTALATADRWWLMSLQWRAGQLPGQTRVRDLAAIPTGALQWRAGQLPGQTCQTPIMAGQRPIRFNGGPDNCPARHGRGRWPTWRASCFNGGPDNCPARLVPIRAGVADCDLASMEGRTIARPDDADETPASMSGRASMEGRTIARPDVARRRSTALTLRRLQWRAGQLPGQT